MEPTRPPPQQMASLTSGSAGPSSSQNSSFTQPQIGYVSINQHNLPSTSGSLHHTFAVPDPSLKFVEDIINIPARPYYPKVKRRGISTSPSPRKHKTSSSGTTTAISITTESQGHTAKNLPVSPAQQINSLSSPVPSTLSMESSIGRNPTTVNSTVINRNQHGPVESSFLFAVQKSRAHESSKPSSSGSKPIPSRTSSKSAGVHQSQKSSTSTDTTTGQNVPVNSVILTTVQKLHATPTRNPQQHPESLISSPIAQNKKTPIFPTQKKDDKTLVGKENQKSFINGETLSSRVLYNDVARRALENTNCESDIIEPSTGAETFLVNASDDNYSSHWPELNSESQPPSFVESFIESKPNEEIRNMLDDNNLSIGERYKQLWSSDPNNPPRYYDIGFEVGSGSRTMMIYAHKLMISSMCTIALPKNNKQILKFPEIQPEAFHSMLKYIYLGPKELLIPNDKAANALMEAAVAVGCTSLVKKCNLYMKSNVCKENAAELFYLAVNDIELRQKSLDCIMSNPKDVLFSDGFLTISEDCLRNLLNCDEWYLDELEVFEAVIRWAKARLSSFQNTLPETKQGEQIRSILGKAFYEIRFLTLDFKTFTQEIDSKIPGLFERDELIAFFRCWGTKDDSKNDKTVLNTMQIPPQIAKFNIKPRNQESLQLPTSTTGSDGLNSDEESPMVQDDSADYIGGIRIQAIPVRANEIAENTPSKSHPVPPKKRKISHHHVPASTSSSIIETSTLSHSTLSEEQNAATSDSENVDVDVEKVQSLQEYIKQLPLKNDTLLLTEVCVKLKLTQIPNCRVSLPNLKLFKIDLVPKCNCNPSSGSNLKTYLKGKLSSLSDILFFDKFGYNGTDSLCKLIDTKVDISITCYGVNILQVDHTQGILLINLIKEAQSIINGCNAMQIRKLAISECELSSVDEIQKNCLEVIVMRRVKGLKNHARFLSNCSQQLREISWSDFNFEDISLTEDILKEGRCVEKLGFVKCKFAPLYIPPSFNYGVKVQELYLDNCDWKNELVVLLPTIFPNVKRVLIYGKKNDSFLLYNLLQMKFIEYIFLWDFIYNYEWDISDNTTKNQKVKKKKILTREGSEIRTLLEGIFPNFKNKEMATFEIKRKTLPSTSTTATEDSDPSADRFDSTKWTGREFKNNEKYSEISRMDFCNMSFFEFFSSFEKFKWFDSKGNNDKSQRRRNSLNTPDNEPVQMPQN